MKRLEDLSPIAHRIIDAAEQLIQQNGYNGFSYDDISRQVGLKKPSIHHHFATKANLVSMVVERYTSRFAALLSELERNNHTALHKLNGYIQLFSKTFETNRRLCVCGMLGAEADILPPEITKAVGEFFELNQQWLTKVFEEGTKSLEFKSHIDSKKQALYLLSALEGAMIVGRGVGSDSALLEVAQSAIHSLVK
nr:TetR/AcrR family transcriptional regulator [Pigmentibacter ruber]